MKMLLKTLLTVTVALWISFASAQQMEVIELRSKSVEQVLPVLQGRFDAVSLAATVPRSKRRWLQSINQRAG